MSSRVGTRLVMQECGSIEEAHEMFGQRSARGETRLVLVPKKKFFSWVIGVPTGMFALLYKQGRYVGLAKEGKNVLSPLYQVKYLVTQQVVVFDTPVKDCPTKDNVMVSIDMLVVFRIEDAEAFVFSLGPEGLDELLRAQQEEAVRGLARSVSYHQVYTLSGRSTEDMVTSMNDRLGKFGVRIINVTITDVRLPDDLAKALENATTMEMLQKEHAMKQKYDLLCMNNKSKYEQKEEELKNEMVVADKMSEKLRAETNKELDILESKREVQVSQIRAEQNAKVDEIKAQADLVVARCQAEKEKYVEKLKAEADAEVAAMEEEKSSYVDKTLSEANLDASKKRAQAMKFDAEVESECTEKVKKKREFELSKRRLAILQAIAENESTVITGDSGILTAGSVAKAQASAEIRSHAVQMSMDVLYGKQKR